MFVNDISSACCLRRSIFFSSKRLLLVEPDEVLTLRLLLEVELRRLRATGKGKVDSEPSVKSPPDAESASSSDTVTETDAPCFLHSATTSWTDCGSIMLWLRMYSRARTTYFFKH